MSKEPAITPSERERLLAVLNVADPASNCSVGLDEIAWAVELVNRLSTGTPQCAETWAAIAGLTGRSERWCRYMARATRTDPLPVYRVGGMVRLDVRDYNAWLGRARDRGIAERVIQSTPNGPIEV